MTPKKRRQERQNTVITKNRYDVLSAEESDNSETEAMETNQNEGSKSNQSTKPTPNVKIKKPPPLVVHDTVESHTKFVKILKDILSEKFHVKYHKDFAEVFTENHAEYEKLKNNWQRNDCQFHTYSDKNNKKRTLVIKGLHEKTDVQQLKLELESHEYEVHSINLMKNTKQPMYMVTLNGNAQINQIKQQVRFLDHTKITWDNYINKRRITQCHRCQTWGHATTNCYAKPACLKCAGEHLTKDCVKPKTTPAQCVNCGEDHPANATCCAAYKARLEIVESRANMKNQKRTTMPTSTRKYQQIPAIADHNHFPALIHRESTATETSVHRSAAARHLQSNRYTAEEPSQPHHLTAQRISTQRQDTRARASYGTVVSSGQQINSNFAEGNNNPSNLSELLQLSREVKELNKIFDIRKMITAVRTLKNELLQCDTEGEKFQIFLSFCDNLNG